MIVGEHTRGNDLIVNVLKGKKLTNIRTTSKDEAVRLTPPIRMTLEKALAYIEDDELVEVTPKSIRFAFARSFWTRTTAKKKSGRRKPRRSDRLPPSRRESDSNHLPPLRRLGGIPRLPQVTKPTDFVLNRIRKRHFFCIAAGVLARVTSNPHR